MAFLQNLSIKASVAASHLRFGQRFERLGLGKIGGRKRQGPLFCGVLENLPRLRIVNNHGESLTMVINDGLTLAKFSHFQSCR